VADELWRFIIFSEFVFDLPEPLPAALANVPRAGPEAQPLVENLCDWLHNDRRTQALYIERAEGIEGELNLHTACHYIEDLGLRDTFPFKERSFFSQAVDALRREDVDQLRHILARRVQSIWIGRGENQAQRHLLRSAERLIQACANAERALSEGAHSQSALIDLYVGSIREVDRLQREFEAAAGDYYAVDGQIVAVMIQEKNERSVAQIFLRVLGERGASPPVRRIG
jgi:hypothetical protein